MKKDAKGIIIDGVEYIKKSDAPKDIIKALPGDKSNPFLMVGRNYFIRTVTHYFTGKLVWVGNKELTMTDCAWIADTGRFHKFIDGKTVNEVEPFPTGSCVIIGRGSIIDMTEFKAALLLSVK